MEAQLQIPIQSAPKLKKSLVEMGFHQPSIFHLIYSFLDIKCLIDIMPLSTTFYKLANQHFKFILRKHNLITPNFTNETKFHLIYRNFYCREVLVTTMGF